MLPGPPLPLPASLASLLAVFGPLFTVPSFGTFCGLACGFLSQAGRRSVCGMLAGAGLSRSWSHDRAHRFFALARWNPDELGLAVARLVVALLVPAGEPVTVAIDDTLFRRRGKKVGTQRQYTGTAGRTENAQVAVYLAYAAPAGSAFIDRALYLPRSWTDDPGRCRAAGAPEDVAFATKPALARQMIGRALDAGTPAGWAAADEVYGQDPRLRAELARRGLGYVLAVAKSQAVRPRRDSSHRNHIRKAIAPQALAHGHEVSLEY